MSEKWWIRIGVNEVGLIPEWSAEGGRRLNPQEARAMASELVRLADQLDPQPQPPEALAQIREYVKSALNELDALAAHAHEFRMSIPARNTDSDVIIGNALHSLDALLAALDSAEQRAKRYQAEGGILDEIAELYRLFVEQELRVMRSAFMIGLDAREGKKLDKLAEQTLSAKGRLALLRGAIDLADGQVQSVTNAADLLGDDEDTGGGVT